MLAEMSLRIYGLRETSTGNQDLVVTTDETGFITRPGWAPIKDFHLPGVTSYVIKGYYLKPSDQSPDSVR